MASYPGQQTPMEIAKGKYPVVDRNAVVPVKTPIEDGREGRVDMVPHAGNHVCGQNGTETSEKGREGIHSSRGNA
jgi:hypothetical protein